MRNRNLTLFRLMLVLVMAVPLYAYRLALKDGQTILFEKYRVTEKTLFYAGADGKDVAILLQDVDLERTQKLNAGEPVALNAWSPPSAGFRPQAAHRSLAVQLNPAQRVPPAPVANKFIQRIESKAVRCLTMVPDYGTNAVWWHHG